jgi:uncharacterized membrane protein YagU involved in acid resistance
MTTTMPATPARSGVFAAILAGGLTAATLDLIAACLIYHAPLGAVLKSVASGWVGRAAAKAGGVGVQALGLASHYGILLVVAALFVFTAQRLPILRRRWYVAGPLFGVAIYVVMHFVVLPLSAAGASQPQGLQFVEELLGHMFLIGLAISLWTRRALGTI